MNNTYGFVYIVVSVTVFLLNLILAIFRKSKYMLFFAISFACTALAGGLFTMQTRENLFFTSVVANMLLIFGSIFVNYSIRLFYGTTKTWLKRFTITILMGLALNIYLVEFNYNLVVRTVVNCTILIYIFLDLYFAIKPKFSEINFIARGALVFDIYIAVILLALRAIAVIAVQYSNDISNSNQNVNNYSYLAFTILLFIWFTTNIILDDSKLVDEALANEEKYRLITEFASDVIWVFDVNERRFTYYSPSIYQLRGYTPEEAVKQSLKQSLASESYKRVSKNLIANIEKYRVNPRMVSTYYDEVQQPCKNGELIWVEFSVQFVCNKKNKIELHGVSRNINERKKKEEEILFISMHDELTGLFNKNALRKFSEANIVNKVSNENVTVLYIDVDNFRIVNESKGHNVGDQTIKEIADKIKKCVSNKGTVFRYDADDFVVVTHCEDKSKVKELANDLIKQVSSQITINERVYILTTSIGIAHGNADETLEQIIKNANASTYVSKKQKNTITEYSSEIEYAFTRETALDEDMQFALSKKQFEVFYQPIVNAYDEQIFGAEALLRWNHPELGMISPVEFIPISENNKLIIPITEWVIDSVCAKMIEWERQGLKNFVVHVNISLVCLTFRADDVIEFVVSCIRKYGINPYNLVLEITESDLMQKPEEIIKIFNKLREHGIKLALDDFGTGYSSFAYIKDIPLDIIKIDRAFISTIDSDIKQQVLVKAIIDIAHGLDIEIVAEGVENEDQREKLLEYECDYIQGYLYSRPLPEEEFEHFQEFYSKKGIKLCN